MITQCKCNKGERGFMPVYKTKEAACADVLLPEDILINPGRTYKIPLDISFDIPIGFKIVMYPRSSLLVKYSIMQPTSIIDSDYSGMEVHVPLFNAGDCAIAFKRGDAIAQIECVPKYDCMDWIHKQEVRTGGFGSTGK